ncbi:MAG: RNA polymerase sigma factor [Bacteroidota bacterium]
MISAILKGGASSERAVADLYESLFAFAIKAKRRYNLSEQDIQDCYSDAITALVQKVKNGEFLGESKLSTYFYSILSNKCVDKVRRLNSQKSQEEAKWTHELPEVTDRTWDFLGQWDVKEEVDRLSTLMNQIGEKCKQLLLDLDYHGYQPEEMIERMGFANLNSIKTQKYKCKKKLLKLVHQHS